MSKSLLYIRPTARRTVIILVCLLAVSPLSAIAQRPELPAGDPARTWKEADSNDGRWNETDVGPFLASVINTPGGNVAKGLSIKVGDKQQAAVCYDTATCTMRAAWTGGFLKFSPRRYGITSSPEIDGKILLSTRRNSFDKAVVNYRGLYQQGRRVVLEYTVDGTTVRETPWLYSQGGATVVTRTLFVEPHQEPIRVNLLDREENDRLNSDGIVLSYQNGDQARKVGLNDSHRQHAKLKQSTDGARLQLEIMPSDKAREFTVFYHSGASDDRKTFAGLIAAYPVVSSVPDMQKPVGPIWPKWLATGSSLGEGESAHIIDTINVPFDNPYKALMFTSGLDFFANGDIAVCTLHGDVWLVRGVDDDLVDVKWKRYATGLCQPLGLKIVDDKVFVLGKDQITRLHDRNADDEADFYECFNNGGQTSLGGHDFAACLETDPDGNFYYIRAHEGVCRVSKDGKTHESIATGFRNPIGLGVSPTGLVTAAPQEGNWTPSSAIFAVKKGGYYGFGGPRKDASRPLGYDPPLCWMPRSQDNSSGGQVWVASDKWGLPRGTMLHLSYGLCTALVVLPEEIDGVYQGGTVKLPLFFESGACRGRFSPRDGQLYVCGLMGWQTAAAKDGCLQRVRHTGRPVQMPVGLKVEDDGIAITFNHPLDPKSAGNPDNYFIEQWNYVYSKDYGSKDHRPSDPKKFGRDEVFIDEVKLSNDNRTVHLKLEETSPVMQMGITYQIKAADGADLKNTVYNTINIVPQ